MANSIALVTAYLADTNNLFGVYKAAALTADLETPGIQYVGADTIKAPSISFSGTGMSAYSRSTGYSAKDVTLTFATYKLSQDLGDELKIDKMDSEESGTSVITFVNEYTRQVVVPTVDKYRLAALKTGGTKTVTGALTTSNIVTKLDEAFVAARNGEVNTEGSVLYLPMAAEAILKNANGLTKYISEGQWNGQIASKVKMYDDAKVVYVPAARFPANCEFILVAPSAQMSVVKVNQAEYYDKVPGFRGSVVDYNLYHDCFVKTGRTAGVQVGLKASE